MTSRRIGDIIDATGVTLDLADDDLVADVLVIAKVITEHGTGLAVGVSDGMDWVTQLGMIQAAVHEITNGEDE